MVAIGACRRARLPIRSSDSSAAPRSIDQGQHTALRDVSAPCYVLGRMSPRESALLDRSLPISKSRLPLHLWTRIASIHLVRPIGLVEFRVWWEDYNRRYRRCLPTPSLISNARGRTGSRAATLSGQWNAHRVGSPSTALDRT